MTKIFLRDDLPPESLAMVQALYSRDPRSVVDHLKQVEETGADKFMERYYVGYGHASIGDCGSTTLFIEDVSLLAAKAIQDWPLYRGQEASTRYMDFSTARIEDPLGTPGSGEIQSAWMEFYHSASQPMLDHLYEMYPRVADEKPDVYERAIHARKFDILRAFLPAGATTNLSWHTDLRQAADHLLWLHNHPDPYIRALAFEIESELIIRYPSSFNAKETGTEEQKAKVREQRANSKEWRRKVALKFAYHDISTQKADDQTEVRFSTTISEWDVKSPALRELLRDRPRRTDLPHFLTKLGNITTRFFLDFGSFRDLQRHRNGVVTMPILDWRKGFNAWYLDQLSPVLRAKALDLLNVQKARLAVLDIMRVPAVVQQYYCAMGFNVMCEVTQGLPAFIYRIELRTGQSVHPTLRRIAKLEAEAFAEKFPEVALYADTSPDAWSIRRGEQTIVVKT